MKWLFWIALYVYQALTIYDITDFGAIKSSDTLAAQRVNSQALLSAIKLANKTLSEQNERVVKIPKGTFYFMPIMIKNISNVSIIIEGKMSASNILKQWPFKQNNKEYQDFINCQNCQHITLSGGGKIDGRGYPWWLLNILNNKKIFPHSNGRPKLIQFQQSRFISIHDLTLKNSPSFHIKLASCFDVDIYNLNIKVNTTAQINLLKRFSLTGIIPLFPLNTDGIDPSGARMHIYNISVQNYDDVVVPKPSHQGYYGGNCTQDILVQNATVVLGVGMSIGSVPPNVGHNCIKNITFRNVHISRPLKGIYVKTNPGNLGSGQIKNILFQNFTMDRPIWWAIYIGPQQQKQPDGGGPGCMLYPYDPHNTCGTQPLIDIENIKLQNIKIHQSLLFPIVIRCNKTNPCKSIQFNNVEVDKWTIKPKGKGYVCENAEFASQNSFPKIQCKTTHENYRPKLRTQAKPIIDNIEEITRKQYWKILEQMEQAAIEVRYQQEDDEVDQNFNPFQHFNYDSEISKEILKVLKLN